MAQPTNTYDSYDIANSIKEDVASVIYDISPVETPVLSMAQKTTATNTYHEWQTDELSPPADNAHIEGDDTIADAVVAPTRVGNYTQIAKKAITVSGTQKALDFHGIKEVMAREMIRRGEEMKRDIERAITSNTAKVAGNNSTPRKSAGIQAYLVSNTSGGSGGSDPSDATGSNARSAGTARAFTEDMLLDMMESVYTNGGNPDCLIVGVRNKRVVSSFSGGATTFRDDSDKRISNTIDIYESDHGSVEVIADRFSDQTAGFVLQKDMIGFATMRNRNFAKSALAKTGDSEKMQILTEFTLEVRNEASCGIIADLTTS